MSSKINTVLSGYIPNFVIMYLYNIYPPIRILSPTKYFQNISLNDHLITNKIITYMTVTNRMQICDCKSVKIMYTFFCIRLHTQELYTIVITHISACRVVE